MVLFLRLLKLACVDVLPPPSAAVFADWWPATNEGLFLVES